MNSFLKVQLKNESQIRSPVVVIQIFTKSPALTEPGISVENRSALFIL